MHDDFRNFFRQAVPFAVAAAAVWIFCAATPLSAHKVSSASLILYINTEDERTYRVSIATEVASSGDAALDDEIGPEEAARMFAENNLLVLIDEKEQEKKITTELVNESDADTPEELQQLAVLVEWKAALPPDGTELALFLKETSEMSIVMATVKNGVTGRRLQVLFPGEYSKGENVEPLVKGDPFAEENKAGNGTGKTTKGAGGNTDTAGPGASETNATPKREADNGDSSPAESRFWKGSAALVRHFAFAMCVLLSGMMMCRTSAVLARALSVFLAAQFLGFLLASTGTVPVFSWSAAAAGGAVIFLAASNLFAAQFKAWRYAVNAIGAFFLGILMAGGRGYHGAGAGPGDWLPYEAGFLAAAVAVSLAASVVLLPMGRFLWFKRIAVVPFSVFAAGVALYLIAGNWLS